MPRPDLASIGVGYRKIPIIAIGKDIYCDTRLIISKLELLYAEHSLGRLTPSQQGIRRLFENWTVDGGLFANAVKLMPYWDDNGVLSNKAFVDDRQELSGGWRMTTERMRAGRPDGLQNMQQAFDLLEKTFLADGRDWILGTKEPTVADIDAVWPFEWLIVDKGMQGSIPENCFGEQVYPKLHAWVHRFMAEVKRRRQNAALPVALDDRSMRGRVMAGAAVEDVAFDTDNLLQLRRGDEVEVFPSDYGKTGKSTGELIGLTVTEVVLRNKLGISLHFPRWNFSITKSRAVTAGIPFANL